MIEFIAAVYNEENEIEDLIKHVRPYVDRVNLVDDGSTDQTWPIITGLSNDPKVFGLKIAHTGLPETVKHEALDLVRGGSWVIMLDADERFADGVLEAIVAWCSQEQEYDYVYCRQLEIIDGRVVREFQKAKVFRKEAIRFPLNNIHADDQFEGAGIYISDWVVLHRKSSYKQIQREQEYLKTYKKLLDEGKIDQGRYEWLRNLHHYVK